MSKAGKITIGLFIVYWVLAVAFTFNKSLDSRLVLISNIIVPVIFGFLEGYFANVYWALLLPISWIIAAFSIQAVLRSHAADVKLWMFAIMLNFLYLLFFCLGSLFRLSPMGKKIAQRTN